MKRNLARLILILAVIAWAIIVVSVLVTPVNADAVPIEEPKPQNQSCLLHCSMNKEEMQASNTA